jgi:SpoVK/Ycf46/Vps4 family AAA+-type ATPase
MMNSLLTQLTTGLSWHDVNTGKENRGLLDEIINWLRLSPQVTSDFKKKIKPGFRALFYGPAGADKTLAAALIGKEAGKPVYRVDFSQLVSNYAGETEKNLAAVFKEAEKTESVLFFDEADAVFGKRTGVRDSHDKYANMEAAYLIQRMEEYEGLVILATNRKNNIDDAFIRRFRALIHFGLPKSGNKKQAE